MDTLLHIAPSKLMYQSDISSHSYDFLVDFVHLYRPSNLSSSIYSTELYTRLRAFLVACPPAGPIPLVVELVIAAADFQRDLALWNISYIKGGVDAKELFHVYIILWIQDKRLALLEFCKFDKAIPDVEKAVIERLERQYTEVLSPIERKRYANEIWLKYVQNLAKGNLCPYNVSAELGAVLNSMKRMLDVPRTQIEAQLKMWVSCNIESGNMVAGKVSVK